MENNETNEKENKTQEESLNNHYDNKYETSWCVNNDNIL